MRYFRYVAYQLFTTELNFGVSVKEAKYLPPSPAKERGMVRLLLSFPVEGGAEIAFLMSRIVFREEHLGLGFSFKLLCVSDNK